MNQIAKPDRRPSRRSGFTLIELLIVMAIILVLVGILLPVAGRVRTQAQAAHTQATMVEIAGAIERYYQDNHSYPGLLSNAQLAAGSPTVTINPSAGGSQLTSSENLVAALCGGILAAFNGDGSVGSLAANVDDGSIGKGPLNFSSSVIYRVRKTAYIDSAPGTYLPDAPFSAHGCSGTNPEQPGTPPATMDTNFPEFQDRYGTPRPIIYLRANAGVNASVANPVNPVCTVMSSKDTTAAQYNTFEFNYYQRGQIGDFTGDFAFNSTTDYYVSPADYLKNPNVANQPRGKDKFILISAGSDRIFGTKDDIFYGN